MISDLLLERSRDGVRIRDLCDELGLALRMLFGGRDRVRQSALPRACGCFDGFTQPSLCSLSRRFDLRQSSAQLVQLTISVAP